jgi:transcriptional regulator GlxA family with amidase domain/DNA-directed RNA polymerase subunit RPC12/RpoP
MNHSVLIFFLLMFFPCFCFSQTPVDADSIIYVCPPCNNACDDLKSEKEGFCTHCGMRLMPKSASEFLNNPKTQETTIGFYLQDGIEILDFAGPMEVFSAAGFQVFTFSKTKDQIRSQGLINLVPDYDLSDCPQADILAFFGGNTGIVTNDDTVISWIQNRRASTHYFFSVCTGAFIIGKAGILENLTATTFHTQIVALQSLLPNTRVLSDIRFVDNGTVITTAGISAGIDGALHLVAKLKGESFAKQVAQHIEYDKWIPEDGLIIQE